MSTQNKPDLNQIIGTCVDSIVGIKKKHLVVGVVGNAGSGKSYFSKLIQDELDNRDMSYSYVNHDEFLIPRGDRSALKEIVYDAGEHKGKSHWEVLENWFRLDEYMRVINAVCSGQDVSFYPYERSSGDIGNNLRVIPESGIVIFDTSMFAEKMDFTILIDTSPEIILQRKIKRDSGIRGLDEVTEIHEKVQLYQWERHKPKSVDLTINNDNISSPKLT